MSGVEPGTPDPAELRAFARGALPPERFAAVEAWLDGLPEDEQERLLTEAGPIGEVPPPSVARSGFTGATRVDRYVAVETIGDGGMGVVRRVHDVVLDRDVAVKACRPRRPHRPVLGHQRLRRQLEHEARITAALEHPGIVPVHEIGYDDAGEPAFAMRLLDGEPLDRYLDRHAGTASPSLADRVRLILRVAEAIAYAHGRGIVHRDLKPENVLIGDYGTVTVIDWGLAAAQGSEPEDQVVGTPLWMPPEQFTGAVPDRRSDVWNLGALLQYAVIGSQPRSDAATGPGHVVVDPHLPRGLRALVARSLAERPEDRYLDAGAVAAELRRWLSGGITRAQRPGPGRRLLAWARTHRPAAAAFAVLALGLAAAWVATAIVGARRRERAEAAIVRLLADLPAADRADLQRARRRLDDLAADAGTAARERARIRIDTALAMLRRQAGLERQCRMMQGLAARYTASGPWPTETRDRFAALRELGFVLTPTAVVADAARLARHPLRGCVQQGLVLLQRAARLGDAPAADRFDRVVPAVLDRTAARNLAAVARIYAASTLGTHQLELPDDAGADLELALADPDCADLLLQSHRPGPALMSHARRRVADNPDAFWPRIVLSRSAFADGDYAGARTHALVALGKHADSIWSHLALSYAAMGLAADAELLRHARRGRSISPANLEFVVLEALALARKGELASAQEMIDDAAAGPHFRYHIEHPAGHPMDRSVAALVAAGVVIPPGPAERSPVVPRTDPR